MSQALWAAPAWAATPVRTIDWDGDDWEDLVIGAPVLGNGTAASIWGAEL